MASASSPAVPGNVLLTCAGRRNYLVRYFREALAGRGLVIAADASENAAALFEADRALVVPPVGHPDYIDVLVHVCVRHGVRLLVPLNDLELPLLSRERGRLLGVGAIPVVSAPDAVDLCFDKRRTAEHLAANGIATALTFVALGDAGAAIERGELRFPVVVKPRWGTASLGIEFPHDRRELELAYELVGRRVERSIIAGASASDPGCSVLVQECLQGQEYGLDVVNDLLGRHVVTFVKWKHAMRAGETDRAETVDHPELRALGERIAALVGHIGNLDCDVFMTSAGPVVLEMNPRFGGGYPFSHVAGANLPAALLAWARGEEPDPAWLRVQPGIISAKCDRLVVKPTLRIPR